MFIYLLCIYIYIQYRKGAPSPHLQVSATLSAEAAQFGSVSACRLLLDHGLKTRKAMAPDRERNSPSTFGWFWKDGFVFGCFVRETRKWGRTWKMIIQVEKKGDSRFVFLRFLFFCWWFSRLLLRYVQFKRRKRSCSPWTHTGLEDHYLNLHSETGLKYWT